MNDVMGKVVEDGSAILRGYGSCSIHANHRDMTKFSGRSDAGYGQLLGVLRRWIQDYESRPHTAGTVQPAPNSDRAVPSGGIVFNGQISGRNVVSGTQTTGGTTNFNFS